MAQQPECPSDEDHVPRVRIMQNNDCQPSLRLFTAMILLAALLGAVLILGANLGEFVHSQQEIRTAVAPPHTLPLVGNQNFLSSGNWTVAGQDNRAFHIISHPLTRYNLEASMSREMPDIARRHILD